MIKQYIKQALSMLRENPLISVISILGTALSIAMIMIVILVFQVQLTNFVPEVNRDRMLYVEQGTEVKTKNSWSRGNMSVEAVRECFYSLKTPEAVSAWFTMSYPLSLPGRQMFKTYKIFYTDPGFWKVYAFSFLEGKPFTEADFTSGIHQAVVCESVARGLYGTTQVVGKPVIIDRQPFTICGVVKDVSRASDSSYGQVWTPYTTNPMVLNMAYLENMSGAFNTCLLARDASDFDTIRQELKGQIARYNSTKQEAEIHFFHNPITRFDKAIGTIGQVKVELKDFLAEMGGLLLFLLLVPALNLMGVTQSAVQKRRGEMGVRKAFGATSAVLVRQVLYENSVTTLLGGVIGLILSFLLLTACRDFLLPNADTTLQGDMLFKPGIFFIALLFCLLLNLLSAGIPALRIANEQIVGSLKGEDSIDK